MREIVFDTETTGFDPLNGDKVCEIGMVEIIDFIPTGKVFHKYINPMMKMPIDAFKVHGLSDEFLADKPIFGDKEVCEDMLEFIGDSGLVAHNAEFDRKFLNHELSSIGMPIIEQSRCVDTIVIARRKFPGAPASLDALCKRFGIDLKERNFHGALLDANLLADVYLELMGGRERAFGFIQDEADAKNIDTAEFLRNLKPRAQRPVTLPSFLTPEEEEKHKEFIAKLGENAFWNKMV